MFFTKCSWKIFKFMQSLKSSRNMELCSYSVSPLLTLPCIGGVEGYFVLYVGKIPVILQTLRLWLAARPFALARDTRKYYQQMPNHTRIKSNNRLLIAKTSVLKLWNAAHLAWSLSLLNHSLKWSIIEVVAATTLS